jgi:hypothetical protein
MGAILSVNLLKNGIGVEQARALVIILKEHSTLKSLCGNNGDETELDMSGKMNGAEDAIMLVPEIIDNGAMTALNISSNSIVSEYYMKAPRKGIKVGELIDGNPVIEQEDSGGNIKVVQLDGIKAIAGAIPDMRALTKFDISKNDLMTEGAKIIAAILPKCT